MESILIKLKRIIIIIIIILIIIIIIMEKFKNKKDLIYIHLNLSLPSLFLLPLIKQTDIFLSEKVVGFNNTPLKI